MPHHPAPCPVTLYPVLPIPACRYYLASEQLPPDPASESLRGIFMDVVAILVHIFEEGPMEADRARETPSAPSRFVAALQSAVQAAAAAGADVSGDEHRWEEPAAAESGAAAAEVADAPTRMFWRNVQARAAGQSAASAQQAIRRFARLDCLPDPDVSVAASLHPPLTHRRRPRDELPPQLAQPEQLPAPAATTAAAEAAAGSSAAPAAVKKEAPARVPEQASPFPGHQRTPPSGAAAVAVKPEQQQQQRGQAGTPARGGASMVTPPATRLPATHVPGSVDLYGDLQLSGRKAGPTPASSGRSAPPATAQATQQAAKPPAAAAGPAAGPLGGPPSVAAPPTAAQPQQTGVDTAQDRQSERAVQPASAPAPAVQAPQQQQQEQRSPGPDPATTKVSVPAGQVPPLAAAAPPQQQQEQQEAQPSGPQPAGAADMAALLANPAALQALLKDPARLQKLLEANPKLMTLLKSRLGKQ